jgi:hypothetical protein
MRDDTSATRRLFFKLDIPVTRLEGQLQLEQIVQRTNRECCQVMWFGLAYVLYVPALYTP